MENKSVTINVMIDAKTFRQFAFFNDLYRLRRWVSPVVFASIMVASACVCFINRDSSDQAAMLGCVLLIIGLGIPAFHMWTFWRSVKSQIKAHKLEKPRSVYSLRLSDEPDGVRVTTPGGESARYEWGRLYGVYRVSGCVYLYVAKNKAFLLPDGQAEEGAEALWSLLTDILPPEKLHDHRKIK